LKADFQRRINLHWRRACDGKRFIVRADEKLTAFVELEAADLRR
jgi:hypothetical protein